MNTNIAGNRHDLHQILSKGLTHFFTISCFTEVIYQFHSPDQLDLLQISDSRQLTYVPDSSFDGWGMCMAF